MRGSIKKEGTSWFVSFDLGKDILQAKKRSKKVKEDLKQKKEALAIHCQKC